MPTDRPGVIGWLYLAWATIAIGLSLWIAGLTTESITRLLVLGFLLLQLVARRHLAAAFPALAPRTRFIVLGTLLAAVVEGFHMISTPVLPQLAVHAGTAPVEALRRYAIDLALTVPAYLVIFGVIWWFVARFHYARWTYIILFGAAQALGDGGIYFFAAAPGMIAFLPYPMTNYHAVNIIPFLATRDGLPAGRRNDGARWLALPAVMVTYFVCGAMIKVVAGWVGL
ncbi:MAG: hypothetical protein IPJ57_12520 [Gemmatimonadetes bacterium]|nr:hypothetical protein [Gemmatimonadota bacterium]